MRKTTKIVYYLLTVSIVLAACKGMTKTQKGAIIGTSGGAAVGAVIGRASGNTALGTIIGAAVGGTAGVLIGKKMDKQAEEIKKLTTTGTGMQQWLQGLVQKATITLNPPAVNVKK